MRRNDSPILSRKQIWRSLVLLTMLSIAVSMCLSTVALLLTTTGKSGAVIEEKDLWASTLLLSALIPGIICPLVVHALLTTVRELNLVKAELDDMARKDALTRLLNRRGFDRAALELIASTRQGNRNIAVLMCDIDLFKRINDVHGHEGGDHVIRNVASTLSTVAAGWGRAVVGRQGGEEFAICVDGVTPRELANMAEALRRAVETSPILWEHHSICVTISLGTSLFPGREAELKSLMISADKALYEAKRRGRNRVERAVLPKAA